MNKLINNLGKPIEIDSVPPEPVVCEYCNNHYFIPVYVLLKRIGITNIKNPMDGYEAVASFRCANCGKIIKDLDPLEE